MAPVQRIRPDEKIHIGTNIRMIRKDRKISQKEMAELLQLQGIPISRETYVKIERGIRGIRASEMEAIRDILHTTYEELFQETIKE